MGKVTEINIAKEKLTIICNECYFYLTKQHIEKKYYKDNSDNKLVDRYLSNEYFDTADF